MSTRLNLQVSQRAMVAFLSLASLLRIVSGPAYLCAQQNLPTPRLLTHAGDVHDLPAERAENTHVHLVGNVTYYDPGDAIMFLQDKTGGVYVNTSKPYPVHNGDLVELDGTASPSYRTEIAPDPEIHILGRGPKLPSKHFTYEELVSGRGDCSLVTIQGKVRAADVEQHYNSRTPSIHLDVTMAGGEVQVYLAPLAGFRPESLLDSIVEITGAAGGAFDAKYQLTGVVLYAPDSSSVTVIQKGDSTLRKLPLTSIDNVFQSRRVTDLSPPIRVRGTVTYYKKGDSAVLERDGKSIYVQTRGEVNVSVGDIVDAIGFATDHEYAPSLRQAALIPTGEKEQITPRALTYAEANSGRFSDNLVSITGLLVSQLHDPNTSTVVLNTEGHLIRASLEQDAPIDNLRIGSRIRVVGVCRFVPVGAWRAPYLSHIEMRSPGDVQLISNPSWYTVEHLIELLGALIVVALVIAVWAVLLRRRVVHQTAWISRSMIIARERSRILEMISSNHSLEEILGVICDSVMKLLPGATCAYYPQLDTNSSSKMAEPTARQWIDRREDKLYEVPLAGANDQIAGKVVVTATDKRVLPSDSTEIYAVLAELSCLAMKQSLLYEGLVYHSTHDPLTELPNRRLCESRLASALRETEQQNSRLAVIYIDVNRFKQVNDKYGHKAGDLYLQQISSRLMAQMRPIDMLARIGGDEFVVISPFSDCTDHAEALTARLQACFEQPFHLESASIAGSASFGFARYPEDGTTMQELTRKADHAMYIAKRSDLHGPEDLHNIAIITADELEVALARDQFRLAYQPQFSASGRLSGLEALIRLEDPVLGLLTPDAFIAVAERHDVIIGIGTWVLRTALQDATRWNLQTGESLSIAINVSLRQLESPGYVDSVLACLNDYEFPPDRLELELVERSLTFSGSGVTDQLSRLRQAGVRISLDDFGTGQSSLSLLHKLPIDTIKLDRSFIRAMDDEPNVLPVIQAIVSMAYALGKRVVAEAIEHSGPIPTLLKMGAMDFQGYLLGRPILAEEVDRHIPTWRSGIVMPQAFREASRQESK